MPDNLYLVPTTPRNGGKHNGAKRTYEQREHDLPFIADLYLRKKTMQDILKAVNARYEIEKVDIQLSINAVYHDLEEIQKRWINSALVDFNQAKGRELDEWNTLEKAYWDGYERSMQPKTTDERQKIYNEIAFAVDQVVPTRNTKRRHRVEERDGSVTFLQGVERCVDARCKILGLYSPEKFQVDWRVEASKAGIDPDRQKQLLDEVIGKYIGAMEEGSATPEET